MIRLRNKTILIPRGDTGVFSIMNKRIPQNENLAVLSVYDPLTNETVLEKTVSAAYESLTFFFEEQDTINLFPKKYLWDIKLYSSPYIKEGEMFWGSIDSYYSAYGLPSFIITEVTNFGNSARND